MKKYSWDFECGDVFRNVADTVDECIEQATRENEYRKGKARIIYVGVNNVPNINYGVMADEIISDLKEQAFDICGEASDCWLDDVTPAQISKLESMLSVTVQRFLKEEGIESNFYEVDDIKEVNI